MKTVFIKSGGYYETPGVAVSGAINDAFDFNVSQHCRSNALFMLDYVSREYRLSLTVASGDMKDAFARLDMDLITKAAEEHGFSYVGLVADEKAMMARPDEFLRDLSVVTVCKETGKFLDAKSGTALTGNNITPVIYCVKMADSTYAMILSQMANVMPSMVDNPKVGRDDMNVIVVNDGDAMRSQFVDVSFHGATKHFRNNDLVTGFAVFAWPNALIEVNIFKDTPLAAEFKKNFELEVDSSFDAKIVDGKVVIQMPPSCRTGYLSIKLKTTPLYEDVSSREIKEMLSFDFIVTVV
ncbi:hypothetical protein [Ralstonia phage RP31]|uniref:Uncharacterized protein n=2 Tax=Ripduovirus RP12 TaxID=2560700 RepID=A0A1L7N0Q3_9CAUD|nr:hypothetical protein FDH28_gp075 [Ralstonia phage RP12]BAW19049.1 hypothetical protein [Ralstonia phage RP12]BAW19334.1 hypothetical protein [Ralstonia phage RP31]